MCAHRESVPEPFVRAVDVFNAGQFYAAHEILEDECWRPQIEAHGGGLTADFYQGILQIGVGFHHAQQNNYRGAINLIRKGIARLELCREQSPFCDWMDVSGLISGADRVLSETESGDREGVVFTFPDIVLR